MLSINLHVAVAQVLADTRYVRWIKLLLLAQRFSAVRLYGESWRRRPTHVAASSEVQINPMQSQARNVYHCLLQAPNV